MGVNPLNPQIVQQFIAGVNTRLAANRNPAAIKEAVRQQLLDTFDTNRSGHIDQQEHTNLPQILDSLSRGNREEQEMFHALFAVLQDRTNPITIQPPPVGNHPHGYYRRILNNRSPITGSPLGDISADRNNRGFQMFGGTTHILSNAFLDAGIRNMQNLARLPQNASAYDRGKAYFNTLLNQDLDGSGSHWMSAVELQMFTRHLNTLQGNEKQECMRGFQDAQIEKMKKLSPEDREVMAQALAGLENGINVDGLGEGHKNTYHSLCSGLLTKINSEFGIDVNKYKSQVASGFQIHFVQEQEQAHILSPLRQGIQQLSQNLALAFAAFPGLISTLILDPYADKLESAGEGRFRIPGLTVEAGKILQAIIDINNTREQKYDIPQEGLVISTNGGQTRIRIFQNGTFRIESGGSPNNDTSCNNQFVLEDSSGRRIPITVSPPPARMEP